MPIQVPGLRDRRGRYNSQGAKRNVMVELSLTSMVDIFTILVIFLLQHYSSTGEIIYIPKEVKLPKAEQIKELKPAHVVTLTDKEVVLDKTVVATLDEVKNSSEWMIPVLREKLAALLKQDEADAKKNFGTNFKQAMPGAGKPAANTALESFKKVTVQADREMDFLTIKKLMFTITEAGASEINFAVMKKEDPLAKAEGG
ncbi:MAG: biopolymer transporter ExbD [Oligoflexia bacterium]|nr:biopolymer transporter ExbD [Oligoflexia bacterium]